MEKIRARWQKSGIGLAIFVLIVAGCYFLTIFVKQSWNQYQLTKELRQQEERVAQLEAENERLEGILERYTDEEGRPILVKQNLPYKEPGEQVAIPVAQETGVGGEGSAPAAVEAPLPEELAAQPAWRQWWQVIFTPALAGRPSDS